MSARNPDGRFRNHNKPIVLSADMLRSRWLEGEVLRLKRLGSATKRSRCRSPRSVAGRGPPHSATRRCYLPTGLHDHRYGLSCGSETGAKTRAQIRGGRDASPGH
jgi:hypothetical protein